VVWLMQAEGLVARPRKRFKSTTMSDHDQPVAANLLDRDSRAEAANRSWVGDTTELGVGSGGKLYLAAILGLYPRFVLDWAISAVNDRHVAIKALEMALRRRCPGVGLLHHSDQGCTYVSEDYQAILKAHGITFSMSRRGDCYDNAVMELSCFWLGSRAVGRLGRGVLGSIPTPLSRARDPTAPPSSGGPPASRGPLLRRARSRWHSGGTRSR
jgi:transposase InsO family protein